MAKNWAIVIGVNQYDFLQPLNYAKVDAHKMQEFLRTEAGFERIFFFSDDSPEIGGKSTRPYRANLLRIFRQIFEKPFLGAGDNFWFFFSGHGMRYADRDYLLPSDADPGDVDNTGIRINYITERLRRCGADNVVLFLDACRNQGTRSGEGIGHQTAEVARQAGVITFFSCSPNEFSFEIDALQQGAFTYALLEGLGSQGQCATVERLNDYLNRRVPELNRQHGKNFRQTPYTIAEPVTKSHLILLPRYATVADIARLKIDAFHAEVEQEFALAEQLWIRVLGATPGVDMDAVKALQRIERLRLGQEPVTQLILPSGKEEGDKGEKGEKGDKDEEPTKIWFFKEEKEAGSEEKVQEVKTAPILLDVPQAVQTQVAPKLESVAVDVGSAVGISYDKLRDFLADGQWKKADIETAIIMLKVAGRERERWLKKEDIADFPCKDLQTIDQLWAQYSDGRFGFSVQKRIWESVGGKSGCCEYEVFKKFGDRVGWYIPEKDAWKNYRALSFSLDSPEGHLPGGWFGVGGSFWVVCMFGVSFGRGGGCGLELFARLEACERQ